MPREHRAQVSRLIDAPQQRVWSLISDLPGSTAWLTSVASVKPLSPEHGHEVAGVVDRSGGSLVSVTLESHAPERLVREVRDPGGMFGGTWTFELTAQGSKTMIGITENGWIAFAPFRAIQRFFIGFDTTMNAYLDDLARAARKPPQ